MNTKLLKIINHYGIENQLRKLYEEQGEVMRAIDEYQDFNYYSSDEEKMEDNDLLKKLKANVIEEIADNLVLLEQIRLYYDISNKEIAEVMDYKINRTIERIEKGE